MLALVEGLVILGEYHQAAALYLLVRKLVGTGVVTLWFLSRFLQTMAGVAGAARQWDAAESICSWPCNRPHSYLSPGRASGDPAFLWGDIARRWRTR